jgi:multidrug efflux pump subunit AcrA (membrane-fusion protein)
MKSGIALMILLLAACGPAPAPVTPPPAKVTVARPVERDVVEWDEYTARLEAVDAVEVRARVSGYLEAVRFADGATVPLW